MPDQLQENLSEDELAKEQTLSELAAALEANNSEAVIEKSGELHPADVAEYIQGLSADECEQYITTIKDDFDPEILGELEPEKVEQVTEILGTKETAEALAELDSDEVIEFVEELDEKEQQEIIEALPKQSRAEVELGLSFPEDSVGRLMHKRYVTVPEYWNVGQVLDYLRSQEDLPEDFHVIYIVDPKHRPVQYVLTSRVMRNKRDVAVKELATECKHLLRPETDQEEAAYMFQKYGLVSLAIVNENGRMTGVLTTKDIVEIIEEESEEDLMKLGGVGSKDFYSGISKTVKLRLPWLFINTLNAFVAAYVIMQFTDSIEALVALAALTPIVAAIVGNGGAQTLTVTVRAMAKRNISDKNRRKVIMREMMIGFVNGLALAIFCGIAVWLAFGDPKLSLVFSISIWSCFIAAGVIGSAVPIMLGKMGVDPAVASSAFVIALTDIISFAVFLGLATAMLIN